MATYAEIMARVSASMIHAALANVAEKAQQQQMVASQTQSPTQPTLSFPFQLPLISLPPPPMPSAIAPLVNGDCLPTSKSSSTLTQSQENKTTANGNNASSRKRKRPAALEENNSDSAVAPQQPVVDQQLTIPQADRQPSSSPLSSSRISSPDSAGHKARKLKLYAAEEKVDIIDYAKCIGNRAAGREFNVAESSIREWRKNEDKIRRQAESTVGCTQHFEQEHCDVLAEIDDALVRMMDEKAKECGDWYGIAERARTLWAQKAARNSEFDGSEMKITMGWVSRFMRRNELRVPKIAPPIIATGNVTANSASAVTSLNGSVSMVRSSPLISDTLPAQTETRATKTANNKGKGKEHSQLKASVEEEESEKELLSSAEKVSPSAEVPCSSSSRRKCFKPMRVDAACATLMTSAGTMAALEGPAELSPNEC